MEPLSDPQEKFTCRSLSANELYGIRDSGIHGVRDYFQIRYSL